MYEEEQPDEVDIISQLVSQIDIKPPHKGDFIQVKNTRRKPEKHTVERQRPKKINKILPIK